MTNHFREIENRDKKIPLILKLDAAGNSVGWIHWETAVILHWNEKIVWSLGDKIKLNGGYNPTTGERSTLEMPTIIACNDQSARNRRTPILNNTTLFRRDGHLCLYCGNEFPSYKLTRDHVMPTSRGGPNTWNNCVTACRRCNHRKADRTPEEASMELIAVPFTPNRDEFLILQNRRVTADQMEFLKSKASKSFLERMKLS